PVLATVAVAGAVAVGGCGGPFMSDDTTEAAHSTQNGVMKHEGATKGEDAKKHGGAMKDDGSSGDHMESRDGAADPLRVPRRGRHGALAVRTAGAADRTHRGRDRRPPA